MSLQVTVTDNDNVVWTGSLDDFEAANRDGLSEDDFNALWDHGEIDIGGGAAPLFKVTLVETDAATE
jgi:hypothetical protein